MDKQPNNEPQDSHAKPWSDAELRRVSRVFELFIRIDKRLKKGKSNERQNDKPETSTQDTQGSIVWTARPCLCNLRTRWTKRADKAGYGNKKG